MLRKAVDPLAGGENIGDRQPRTIPTKDLPHQVVFWGEWCANSFALAMLIVNFVGVVRGFRHVKNSNPSVQYQKLSQ